MVLFPGKSRGGPQHSIEFTRPSSSVTREPLITSGCKAARWLCCSFTAVLVAVVKASVTAVRICSTKKGAVGGVVAVMSLLSLSSVANATGATDYAAICSGCHGGAGPQPVNFNSVNSLGDTAVINRAITGGMFVPTAMETAALPGIAAFLVGALPPADPPAASPVGFNAGATIFALTTLKMNSVYGGFTTMSSVAGPSKGSVTYDNVTTSISYTPGLNQCGTDSWTYRASGPAGLTSTRTGLVTIASPSPTTSLATQNIAYNTSATTLTGLATGGGASGLTITAQPSVGTVIVGAGPSLTYTASSTAYAASVSFTYTATGPCGTQSTPVNVTINLTTLPPAPTASVPAGPFQTAFNTPAAAIDLTSSITGVSSSVTVMSATNGTTMVTGNAVTFTPTVGFTGTGSFTYRANGPGGASATSGAVNVTVLPAVPTVTAAPGPFTTAFNTPINIDLTGRVTGTFTSIAATAVSNGTTMVAGNVVTFTPTLNFTGTGSFQFTATNAGGTSAPSASMSITVLPAAPVVAARAVSVTFQLPLAIDLTAQISGVSTSIAVVTPAPNGSTSVVGNVITYTPNAAFLGADSFSYQATGPGGVSNMAVVSITVVPAAPPTATSPPLVTTAFNTQVAINLTAQIGGVFTGVAVVTPPTNGIIVSVVGNVITYRPNTGYSGADSFTYQAQGPGGTISTPPALVSITVSPAVPVVTAPATVTTPFNTAVAINLTAQITGSSTSIAIVTAPANGTTSISGNTVTYTPTPGFFGSVSFTYRATGPGGTSLTSPPVNITVLSPGPTATLLSIAVPFAVATTIDLTAQLTGTVTSIAIVTPPVNGTIVSVVGNVVTYMPRTNFSGADGFTYQAAGPGGTSAVATVNITVTAAPPPTAVNRVAAVVFNTPLAIDLTAQISGFFSSIAVVTPPVNGTIVSVVGNVITYAPRSGYVGTDTFTFAVTGPGGTTAPATVTLTIAPPPAPVTANSVASVPFNTATAINLTARITGFFNSIAIASAPEHGTASVSGNVVTYTPTTGYFGPDAFTYTAAGPGGTSAPGTVNITVGTLAPTATALKMIVPLNTSTTMDLGPFITGSAVSGVVVTTAPKHGTATVSGTKLTFTPMRDYFGSDTFTYAAFGNAGTSPVAIVTVTVVGRPDPTKDPAVVGVIAAQADAARRFSKAQITNFQNRMESLHRPDTRATSTSAAPDLEDARTSLAATPATQGASNGRATGKAEAKQIAYLNSSYAAAPVLPDAASNRQNPVPFLSDAVSLVTSGSVNIASLANAAAGGNATTNSGTTTSNAPSLWLAGTANFGTRGANASRSALDFSTSGVSMGVDRRFGDQLVLGVGLGFARDQTDIGSDGSHSRARAYSGVAYGSFQPRAGTFIDGLIGIGSLDFKSQRYVLPINDIARSDRKGRQIFASVAGGVEYRDNGVLFSPYARLDYSSDRLDQNTETGAGQYALTYFRQTTPSVQGVLGVRAESVHQTDFGLATPRLRAEYRREFQGERQSSIGYADSVGGRYGLRTDAVSRNTLVVGVGSEFIYRGGWKLGVDYQLEHSASFSGDSSQGIKFTISKDLDGKDSPYSLIAAAVTPKKPTDIQVDAGFMFDSNVTRAKLPGEKLPDRIYSVNASKSKIYPINENVRAIVTGTIGGEKFDNYHRLSRAMAGLQGEIIYRPSTEFDAPTFAAFAQSTAERYQSTLRNGYRYSVGVSIRQPITDRINLFGAVTYNERFGKSAVFNNRFNAVRLNVDYTLSSTETIYVTGEYRRGQIVSTGLPSLENIEVADVFVQDDAYPSGQFFSYRFDGKTVLSTLGYNLGLGPRHSLDLSWRRAQSTPAFRPAFATSPTSYIADQYSIVYLIRF